jgi:hypothetical protein
MQILLREVIFKPTIVNESLHEISIDNEVRVVNFATSKNLTFKSIMFPHRNIHKYKSQLSLSNKLLLYKTIFEPIWTYGIQLWGTASTSNIEILERFQSKALCMIVDAPWYVPNTLIRRDVHIPSVKEGISHYSSHYSARLTAHPNDILLTLLEPPECKRL